MSLSGLILTTMTSVYQELPTLAIGAGVSAALSYATARATTHFSLGAPVDAAKFTAAAGLAFIGFLKLTKPKVGLENRDPSIQTGISRFTFLAGLAYGVHSLCNPEKSWSSFAKFSGLSAITLLASGAMFRSSKFKLNS